MFKIILIGAVAIITASVTFRSITVEGSGWNELIGADVGLGKVGSSFNNSVDSNAVILAELDNLLENPKILDTAYNNFLAQYKKDEFTFAIPIGKTQFRKTLIKIAENNLKAKRGQYTWTEGVNRFTDMVDEDFSNYLTFNGRAIKVYRGSEIIQRSSNSARNLVAHNQSVSWRSSLTKVKNQGSSCSGYEYASVAQLEAQYFINGGQKLDLSMQQVIDCTRGCQWFSSWDFFDLLEHGIALIIVKRTRAGYKSPKCNNYTHSKFGLSNIIPFGGHYIFSTGFIGKYLGVI